MIKLADGFTDANVGRGTSRTVSSLGNEFYVTVFTGAVNSRQVTRSNRFVETSTTFLVEFTQRIRSTEQETYDEFQGNLQGLVDHLDKYPTLNGGHADIINAFIDALTMPIKYPDGDQTYWTQIIRMAVREGHVVTNEELT